MSVSRQLANLVLGTHESDIPNLARERAKMSIASTIASAAMGYHIESTAIVRDLEKEAGGNGQSSVWFDNTELPVAHAARINALSSDAAASDDSDLRSIAHIGTIISTTSMALGEHLSLPGKEILDAMVLGYEVAGRIDESLTPGRMQNGFHGSVSTIFGGAITAGKLLKLDVDQMTQAISIAATSIGGMAIAADTSWAREYHAGLSAYLGIQAAYAAQKGFIAEENVLEAPRGFFYAMGAQEVELITKDWGHSWDIVTNMAIKLMPGAHPFHAVTEAAVNAAIEGSVDPKEVSQIVISAIQMRNWGSESHPNDLVSAAHSVIYFVACAVADKDFSWIHFSQEKMEDGLISDLQNKVIFDPNPPPLPDRFTHHHGGTVTIILKSGQKITKTCTAPRGSGPRGVDWVDVNNKYQILTKQAGMHLSQTQKSLSLIHHLENESSVKGLLGQLQFNPS